MSIRRAVITAAAPDQKSLPLQRLVDREGQSKTALELILEETVEAGAEEICIVVCPGSSENYTRAAGQHASRLSFIEQDNPRGYGDALFRARDFVGDEPFLHLVSDHVFISHSDQGCAKQVVDLAAEENCIVSGVQETRENMLPYFGTIGAIQVGNRDDLYEVKLVIEKPTPTRAEQDLIVAGLRSSHYLCLSGLHVLTPAIMDVLAAEIAREDGLVQLSPALNVLAQQERYLGCRIAGSRHNIGVKYGLLKSQLALALSGKDRDDILSELLDLVATTRGEA
jgi:UTP--glucose-1-phosphate uridylyltransferase